MSEFYSLKKEYFLKKNKIGFLVLFFTLFSIGNLNAKTLKTAKVLCGTFTIGGASPDYATFTAAVADLNSGSVCGPVVFIVRAGTYNERITINQITGASATNSIQFVGEDKATTKITNKATSTANMVTVLLNGSDYITFRDLTIEASDVANGVGILLTKQADYNNFKNLNIVLNTASTALTTACIAASGSVTVITTVGNNANYNTIDSINMEGGYVGVNLYGSSASVFCSGNSISNCIITNISNYGIRLYYQNVANVKANTINNLRSTSGYGIYLLSVSNIEVIANNVTSGYIASYMATVNKANYNNNLKTKVYSNAFISSGNVYSSYVNSTDYVEFYHNTVIGNYASQAIAYFSTADNTDIRNNIFVNKQTTETSYAINITNGTQKFFDYNIYYSGGTNIAFQAVAQPDLATWRTNYPGTNKNSTIALPNFITTNDPHLGSVIPALNAPYIGVNIDLDGDMRCELAPTIGADESGYKLQPPNGFFVAPDTSFVGSPARFINTSSINPTEAVKYTWYVDNVEKGTDKNLVYYFQNEISYLISMKIESCFGSDSVGYSIDVKKPTSIPESDFIAERTVTELFEDLQLSSVSAHGANSWKWSVFPDDQDAVFSDETVANPLIAFNYSGIYDICLTTMNDLGKGSTKCKKNYISVNDNLFMCGVFNSSISPAGRITDDGDIYANYGNNRRCSFVIQPCALSVNLKFNSFDLADGGDSIAIYDGLNNQGTLLGSFNGSFKGLPGGFRGLTALSGVMYIEWTTSASLNAAGFDASWTSIVDTNVQAPTAGFIYPSNVYTGQEASFVSTSTGKNIRYAWDFNPPAELGGLEGGKKESDRYKWNASGVYNVELVAANCGGADTITKQITVSNITSAPIVNFGVTKVRVPVISQITLIDSSDQAPTSYKWEISPSNRVVYTNSADTSRNPIVYFTAPGLYTVKLIATNALGTDSLTKTSYIEVFSYCIPAVTVLSSDIGISRVQFESIDNRTVVGAKPYNSYFDNFAAPVVFKRSSFDIVLERKTNTDSMTRKIWIDWNQNGSFADSGELVVFENASKKLSYKANIIVPSYVLSGVTILRIGTSYSSGNNTPCGNNPSGEFEDYPIQIAEDNLNPLITMLGLDTLKVEQWHSLIDPGVLANDNLDGNISNLVFTNSNFDSTTVGTYVIRYNVSDKNGNQANEVSRIVEVTPDITPPIIILTGNMVQNAEVNEVYSDSGAIALDYFSRNITNLLKVTDNVDANVLGSYEVVYEVTDGGGNTVKETRTVNVIDGTAPVITANSSDTVYVNVFENLNDQGFTATDNYDDELDLILSYDTSNFNANVTGTYKVNYLAEDLSGNIGIKEIVVIVRDTIMPEISLIGKDVLDMDVFGDYIEEGITSIDNYCTNNIWTVNGNVNTEEVGTYILTYLAKDCEGNSAIEVTRTVNVLDRKAPVLKLIGAVNVNIRERESYIDAGVIISDNYYDEDTLRPLLVVTGKVDSTKGGLYTVCYDLTDPSGNISNSACRIIYVAEFGAGINNQHKMTSIQLYPNPNSGEFKIENKNGFKMTELAIYDMLGKRVYSKIIERGDYTHINIGELPAGMYMVKIKDKNTDTNIKISIVK